MVTWERLIGNLLSLSYAPKAGTKLRNTFIGEAKKLFNRFEIDGQVTFELRTNLYVGKIG